MQRFPLVPALGALQDAARKADWCSIEAATCILVSQPHVFIPFVPDKYIDRTSALCCSKVARYSMLPSPGFQLIDKSHDLGRERRGTIVCGRRHYSYRCRCRD